MEVIGSGLEAGLGSGSGDPNITATQSHAHSQVTGSYHHNDSVHDGACYYCS